MKLNPKNAAAIRAESGNITQKKIREIADSGASQKKKDAVSIKLPMKVYQKYFAGPEDSRGGRYCGKSIGSVVPKGGGGYCSVKKN